MSNELLQCGESKHQHQTLQTLKGNRSGWKATATKYIYKGKKSTVPSKARTASAKPELNQRNESHQPPNGAKQNQSRMLQQAGMHRCKVNIKSLWSAVLRVLRFSKASPYEACSLGGHKTVPLIKAHTNIRVSSKVQKPQGGYM